MRGGKLVNIDEGACLEAVRPYPEIIGKKAAPEFFQIHGTNAIFMEEDKL